jgi:hypothetical protein
LLSVQTVLCLPCIKEVALAVVVALPVKQSKRVVEACEVLARLLKRRYK